MRHARRAGRGRRGVSVIEMVIVSFLTALLSVIISSVWTAFCFPAIEVASRCRQVLEANLAAEALASDFCGYYEEPSGPAGSLSDGRYLGCEFPADDPETLHIKFYSLPDVVYKRDGSNLIRAIDGTGAWQIVASGLDGFGPTDLLPGESGVAIRMTFRTKSPRSSTKAASNDLYATYIIVAPPPDPS